MRTHVATKPPVAGLMSVTTYPFDRCAAPRRPARIRKESGSQREREREQSKTVSSSRAASLEVFDSSILLVVNGVGVSTSNSTSYVIE